MQIEDKPSPKEEVAISARIPVKWLDKTCVTAVVADFRANELLDPVPTSRLRLRQRLCMTWIARFIVPKCYTVQDYIIRLDT